MRCLGAVIAAAALCVAAPQRPQKVLDALNARFPNAQIDKWAVEKEGGKTIYDIEFRQNGRKMEADIDDDGRIQNWEREIAPSDLPAAVKQAIAARYPKAKVKETMAVTDVKDGRDVPEGFEVVLGQPGKRAFEVTIAPDGKFLETPTPSGARP